MMLSDAEIAALKARPENACDAVARRWVTLRPKGKGFVGPCPLHSRDPHARDSTSFECDAEGWVCAGPCSDGGDVIRLVMKREGLDFRAAVEWLGGARAVDPEEAARAERMRAQRQAEREAEHNEWRERERGRAWDILKYGRPIAGTPAERYLREVRGLDLPPDVRLRFDPAARLYVESRPKFRLVHTGPALMAAIQRAGRFAGVHVTFLADPSRTDGSADAAKGKARVVDPETGELLPAKKVRGSKKGGHIDLTGCKDAIELYIGEGIETVLSVWTALSRAGRDLTRSAFWSSVDLGNLGGKARATVAHPFLKSDKGRALRVPGPEPDPDAPGILVPPGVRRIVLLGDGDSDRFTAEQVMMRAARRVSSDRSSSAVRDRSEDSDGSAREIRVAWAPAGKDFNDVLLGR